MYRNRIIVLFILMLFVSQVKTGYAAEDHNAELGSLEKDILEYITPWKDKITIHYEDLLSNESYTLNSKREVPAASTIKLPLALYVMKLADEGKFDLNEKLTYKKHHYYGGSGVIQNDKIGSSYTIEELVEKAMVHSDNIAFIMLKERVGQGNFIQFMKKLGGVYTYPGGRNVTSADDLHLYAKETYLFSKKSAYGEKLIKYLQNTIYNTTIPQGIPNIPIAHKVGMIPKDLIYNDVAIVYDHEPYTLAVTTKGIGYEKSQEVIAGIANIINQHHQLFVEARKRNQEVSLPVSKLKSIETNNNSNPAESSILSSQLDRGFLGMFIKPWSIGTSNEPNTSYQHYITIHQQPHVRLIKIRESWEAAVEKAKTEPIRLTFAGDAMMDWSVKETVKQKGADYPFVHIKEEIRSSDLSVVNLETAITTRGEKYPKEYNFRSDPISLTGLKNAGFQLVSLANNHSFDYGPTGFRDTIDNLKQYRLDYVGGGLNKEEAYAAKTYTIKGRTIKVLAFSRVLPDFTWVATDTKPGLANGYDLALILNTIQKEKRDTDFLFIYIHWGVETKRSPEAFQRTWAKSMIDSGADAVIGSHPHVLQGFEYYNGKPIAYSLGNFLFPNYIKGDKAQTGILHLDIQKNQIQMRFVPYKINQDQIVKQTTQEKAAIWNELQALSFGEVQIKDGMITDKMTVASGEN